MSEIPNNNETYVVDPQDAEQNKLMAVLSYLLFWLPLIMGEHKKSSFVKFHLNQSLLLIICAIPGVIVLSILNVILTLIHPAVGIIGLLLLLAFCCMLGVFEIMGIINAATGKAKKMPLIGGLFTILK